MLAHDTLGNGERRVVVLNDWLCDTSTWDGTRAYLDGTRFTYAFVDLRGYGRSRGRAGAFDLREAASDVLGLAEALGWKRFALVGHSMSSLVVLQLAQAAPTVHRITRVVAIAPSPLGGFGVDDATLSGMQAAAGADDATRRAFIEQRFAAGGGRYTAGWAREKARRWVETSDAAAASAYVAMYARHGLPDRTTRITPPVLAITGEHDMEPMRRAAVAAALGPLCETLTVVSIADSGHYPMQETPPLLVAHVERFLG